MKVKIKKLVKEAVIPTYAKDGDAGMDLTAVSKEEVNGKDYQYISYGTGLSFEIPKGFVGLVFPRSSISKTELVMANSVGVIDSGYRGEVSVRFKDLAPNSIYQVGDRIAQLIIIPYPEVEFEEVEELTETERGTGGYGSSGK